MLELIPLCLGVAAAWALPGRFATGPRARLAMAGGLGALVAVVSGEFLTHGIFLAVDATSAGAGFVAARAWMARRRLA